MKRKGEENKTFSRDIQQKLIDAVKDHGKEYGSPDVVAITGDIAFSGKKKEYEETLEFSKQFKKDLPGKTEFLPVPGNHDADRDLIKKLFSLSRIVNENEMDNFLEDKDYIKDFVNVKFSAFRNFARQLNSSLYNDSADYFWVKNIEDKHVSFLGLNSAWASEGDNDRFNIALGYRQVLDALEKSKSIPNRIVLMHHPPFNWHKDLENVEMRVKMFKYSKLLLYGHIHTDDILVLKSRRNNASAWVPMFPTQRIKKDSSVSFS